jgi:prepilin-type N-terminal cleavage/methylation domain-containing protein
MARIKAGGIMERIKRKGFTLIELIAVIGIIAALVAVLLPMIFGIIDKARVARLGVDMLEVLNATAKHYDDVGGMPLPDAAGPPDIASCSDVASDDTLGSLEENFGNLALLGLPNDAQWAGPYVDRELGLNPWRSPYYLCNLTSANGQTAEIPTVADPYCDTPANIDPWPITTYQTMITTFIDTFPNPRRYRMARAIDRAVDGRETPGTGRVRYSGVAPNDISSTGIICIGIPAGMP